MNCTTVPKKKAIATDRNIPRITDKAFSVLSKSSKPRPMPPGMMEIARHGIFRPEHFSFYDLICIFMAVMVTDIILLDIFNSLGMPTSTTVSMVFELLGATFVVALIKMAGGIGLGFDDLLNTEKALSVILGILDRSREHL